LSTGVKNNNKNNNNNNGLFRVADYNLSCGMLPVLRQLSQWRIEKIVLGGGEGV